MKRIITILAALAALVSCRDWFGIDQPSSVNPDRTAEQEFWGVVGQLVGNDKRTDDYEGMTFKPTIGEPDNGDESVRVVAVNSLEAAVERYNNLVSADITTETSTYTYKSKEVGTLTWNKSSDNRSFATVDVNVAAVPSLQKIIYRSAEQGDVNGSVGDNGSAYYRFGDVIFREGDDEPDEYWICVRPSFDKEGKGKSHWVCVSPLPKANVWPYYKDGKPFTASNGFNYGLPYNLGTDLEWHQDLAELLFAIMYPEQWFQNIGNYSSLNILGNPSGLPIFNDWHCTNIKYHNVKFWKNVQQQWKDKNLVKKIFGISYEEMAAAIKPDGTGSGLHFLYDEYSWSTRLSNKPKLYQVHYTHGAKDAEKNMHKKTKTTVQAQVVEPNKKTEGSINYSFDFRERQLGRELDDLDDVPYIEEHRFFGDAYPRWCVRYAEGIELSANGKYDPQQPIKGFDPAVGGEVYRYYEHVYKEKNLTDEAEESGDMTGGKYGKNSGFFMPGTIVQDEEGSKWICYYGWNDLGDGLKPKDHYARFISFDNIKSSGLTTDGTKIIQSTDLMPEREAPLAADMLCVLFDTNPDNKNTGGNDLLNTVRAKIQELCSFNPAGRVLIRDTLWKYPQDPSVTSPGSFGAISIAYMPEGGQMTKKQPYLRFINDASSLSAERTKVSKEWQYPRLNFYKYYNCESPNDPNKGKLLDLFDCFFKTTTVVDNDHRVKSDHWSRAAHNVNSDPQRQRDGDFWYPDLIHGDAEVAQFTRAKWKQAYHEPVIVARYMQVDDPYQEQATLVSTNGHRLTILYDPIANKHGDGITPILALAAFTAQYNAPISLNLVYMDGQPFKMNVYQ